MIARPTQRCGRHRSATLRDVVLPPLDDDWATAQTIMLIALAEQARTRRDDPVERQRAELASALDGSPPIRWCSRASLPPPQRPRSLAAIGRDDEDAEEVRRVLRPLLVAQLDELSATNASLMDAFRGKLPS